MNKFPVAIIGAGPIGLAAAAHLLERGQSVQLFEAGGIAATGVSQWAHVRLFTPWSYIIDEAARRRLKATDWCEPRGDDIPCGQTFLDRYLEPLARTMGDRILTNHNVLSVTRRGHDRMRNGNRNEAPFLIVAETDDGYRQYLARAVIDASGTWSNPNPMGGDGLHAPGETENLGHIRYGVPDVLDELRSTYAGKRTLVVGSGHSAIGSVLGLVELAQQELDTQIFWGTRRANPTTLWGTLDTDNLERRGALSRQTFDAVHEGWVSLLTDFVISGLERTEFGISVYDEEGIPRAQVDEIIVATGSRPDFGMLQELRLDLDPITEAPRQLGPLVDPEQHNCRSVPPHGIEALGHPENDFFIVGMKSYGRAPTFLLRTGYEQVRSVTAAIAGEAPEIVATPGIPIAEGSGEAGAPRPPAAPKQRDVLPGGCC